MSAKSEPRARHSADNQSIQSVSQLPEVENSDFPEDSSGDRQESVIETGAPLDEASIFSMPANAAEEESEFQTQVNNFAPQSESFEESFTVEIDSAAPKNEDGDSATGEASAETKPEFNSPHLIKSNSVKLEPNNNSLYDSNEKLVFSRSTSDFSESEGEQSSLWKNLLLAAMAPYSLVGVPVVSMFQHSQQQERISSATMWLQFLFSPGPSMAMNAVELGAVVLLNAYIIYLFAGPLYTLARYGQMSARLINLSVHIYEIIPLILALIVVWPKGYLLGNITRVLDTKISFKGSIHKTKIYQGLLKGSITYICLVVLTLAGAVSFELKNAYSYLTVPRMDFYYHLATRFFLILLIPVYLVVVSGVHWRAYSLNSYIRAMADDISAISLSDFQRVKNIFKQNADLTCAVNSAFNLLVSDILLIVVIGIVKDLFQVFMLVAALDSFTIAFNKGMRQVDPERLSVATIWIGLDSTVVVCMFVIIGMTVSKVADTNKELLHIQSYLNDLASNYIEKPSEIYQSYSLVKYYIKTRNQKSDKPATLRLYAVKWIPCVSLRS